MKIKEQTRKLVAGCSKYSFEVVDRTDEVSNHTYGKETLTRFEEIFEEYEIDFFPSLVTFQFPFLSSGWSLQLLLFKVVFLWYNEGDVGSFGDSY